MKRIVSINQTAQKVVAGFFFAILFLIGVAALTFYTQNSLLATMGELSRPSQKLSVLNELQTEMIRFTQSTRLPNSSAAFIQDSSVRAIQSRINLLKQMVPDSLESSLLAQIHQNLDSLVQSAEELREVKQQLSDRNFSEEALQKVEMSIRRRAILGAIPTIKPPTPEQTPSNRLNTSPSALDNSQKNQVEQGLMALLQELRMQNKKESSSSLMDPDSTLRRMQKQIRALYGNETFQRRKLADLEAQLYQQQSSTIGTIQNLVIALQRRALEESEAKNEAAFSLTRSVSVFLMILVGVAVCGISVMIYSILKEMRLSKTFQEKLQVSQQKSEELARSKQEFLANMSHEIRNPLHVIQGYRSVLAKSPLDASQKSHLRMIEFATDTLMEIVNEILDFSKLEAGKLKLESHPFDPVDLFSSIQELFDLKAKEKNLQFLWEMDLPEGQALFGDQLRVKQILNNLLSNSFKFTSKGSVSVKILWVENTLNVEILDTGIGMSTEVKERVFQEFHQADSSTSRKFGGTGLGLAIVHRLVLLSDGAIDLESEEGVGTKIRVMLPMKLADELPEKDPVPARKIDLRGKHILLVDDDPIGLNYLKLILSYFHADLTCYSGGTDFQKNFNPAQFDLALVDLQMPGFSGFQVVEHLKSMEQYANLSVLAITANVFADERDQLSSSGFDGILLKPFEEASLIAALETYFPDRVAEMKSEPQIKSASLRNYSLEDLKKFCMGDADLIGEVLTDLITQTEQDLHRLKKASMEKNYPLIREIIHQLASRLGQVKSPVARKATEIEKHLKLGNYLGLPELLDQLVKLTQELLEDLSRYELRPHGA
ncbi:ATP-binding protein [Algoriphagus namhaensis]